MTSGFNSTASAVTSQLHLSTSKNFPLITSAAILTASRS